MGQGGGSSEPPEPSLDPPLKYRYSDLSNLISHLDVTKLLGILSLCFTVWRQITFCSTNAFLIKFQCLCLKRVKSEGCVCPFLFQ